MSTNEVIKEMMFWSFLRLSIGMHADIQLLYIVNHAVFFNCRMNIQDQDSLKLIPTR